MLHNDTDARYRHRQDILLLLRHPCLGLAGWSMVLSLTNFKPAFGLYLDNQQFHQSSHSSWRIIHLPYQLCETWIGAKVLPAGFRFEGVSD